MLLPQLEEDRYGAEALGIFLFDDNAFMPGKGDPIGGGWQQWPSRGACCC
tara:strand:- start:482 stop:631 length:150 start_codon:yes stop_codon:yes gene_type:complete